MTFDIVSFILVGTSLLVALLPGPYEFPPWMLTLYSSLSVTPVFIVGLNMEVTRYEYPQNTPPFVAPNLNIDSRWGYLLMVPLFAPLVMLTYEGLNGLSFD
jgi:hypothetical protein